MASLLKFFKKTGEILLRQLNPKMLRLRPLTLFSTLLCSLLACDGLSPSDEVREVGGEHSFDASTERPAPVEGGQISEEGYLEINGQRRRLIPADEQIWDGIADGEWADPPTFSSSGHDLPDAVDHARFQTGIRDQGDQPACVDFAVVAGMEAYAYFDPSIATDLSEANLQAFHTEKNLQATLLTAESSFLTVEALWPQDANAGLAGWQEQAHYGILDWKAIRRPDDIGALRSHLAEGDQVNVLLSLKMIEGSWKLDGMVEIISDQDTGWAHTVLLVGYKRMKDRNLEDKWFFKLKNSWGERWGEFGYGWISEDYIGQYALQAAMIRHVKGRASSGGECGDGICSSDENCLCERDCPCRINHECSRDGVCVCQPNYEEYCNGDEVWEHDLNNCDMDRIVRSCPDRCSNGECVDEICYPQSELYCQDGDVWERDRNHCNSDGPHLSESCDYGCENSRCTGCISNFERTCINGDFWEEDRSDCEPNRLIRECQDGCQLPGGCIDGPVCNPNIEQVCQGGDVWEIDREDCEPSRRLTRCEYGYSVDHCDDCQPRPDP